MIMFENEKQILDYIENEKHDHMANAALLFKKEFLEETLYGVEYQLIYGNHNLSWRKIEELTEKRVVIIRYTLEENKTLFLHGLLDSKVLNRLNVETSILENYLCTKPASLNDIQPKKQNLILIFPTVKNENKSSLFLLTKKEG